MAHGLINEVKYFKLRTSLAASKFQAPNILPLFVTKKVGLVRGNSAISRVLPQSVVQLMG